MPTLSRFIRLETHHAPPVRSGDTTLTPVSRALVVDLGPLGFVWNRPQAVLVERGDRVERLPIPDPTGWIMAGLFALTAITTVYSMLRRSPR